MKKLALILLFVLAVTGLVMAQSYQPTGDVLGAHQNRGRGCAGCHQPHSGPPGSGFATTDPANGNYALWGKDVSVLYGTQIATGDNGAYVQAFTAGMLATPRNKEVNGILLCLSCHDGKYTPTNMMVGQSYEQLLGVLPSWYGSAPIPTLLGNDGSGAGNYANDHPVGTAANISDMTAYGLTMTTSTSKSGTVSAVWTVAANSQYDNFMAVYGMPALRSVGVNSSGKAFVACTTCHNQHIMNVFASGAGTRQIGNDGGGKYYQTFFFVRGPYNPGANTMAGNGMASSTTQFCRQCHFGDSNEANNAARGAVLTAF
ncbi:MAG: hypothetical protein LAN37_14190 [Acidobacteriia bacterium]|nr:hypothetical protein [Terriglobia bacterium]